MADIGYANSVYNKLTKKMYENGAPVQFLEGSPFMNWVKKDWELTLAGIRSKQQLVRQVERRFPDTC